MADTLHISGVRLFPGSLRDMAAGLLGWVQLTIDGSLCIDGLTLRRTRRGSLTLSFPARRNGDGVDYFYVRPLGNRARREIERQVLEALGLDHEASP